MATYDFRNPYYGHDYRLSPSKTGPRFATAQGWCSGIHVGDFLILRGDQSEMSRRHGVKYRVNAIRYYRDPADMWTADLEFVRRFYADGQPVDAQTVLAVVGQAEFSRMVGDMLYE